jgi:lipopolysaccharide export system permease protein
MIDARQLTEATHEGPAIVNCGRHRARFSPVIPILQRQVLWEISQTFALALVVATGLLLLLGVCQQLLERGLTAELLLRLLPYLVLAMLPFTIPSALLLAVVLVFGRMGAASEITAAGAAGIPALRLMTPSFVVAAALSVCTLLLTDQVVPWASARIEDTILKYPEELLMHQLERRRCIEYGFGGIRISVAGMNGKWMIRPVIQYRQATGRSCVVHASTARIEIQTRRGLAVLHVRDAIIDLPDARPGETDKVLLAGARTIELPFHISRPTPNTRELTMDQILVRTEDMGRVVSGNLDLDAVDIAIALTIGDFSSLAGDASRNWETAEAAKTLRKLRAEVHGRLALACSCLCLILFGSPLAALQAYGRLLTNLLFCFMPVTGIYYTVTLGIAAQCKAGSVPPIAMWGGDAILIGLAYYCIRRLVRH